MYIPILIECILFIKKLEIFIKVGKKVIKNASFIHHTHELFVVQYIDDMQVYSVLPKNIFNKPISLRKPVDSHCVCCMLVFQSF